MRVEPRVSQARVERERQEQRRPEDARSAQARPRQVQAQSGLAPEVSVVLREERLSGHGLEAALPGQVRAASPLAELEQERAHGPPAS